MYDGTGSDLNPERLALVVVCGIFTGLVVVWDVFTDQSYM